MAATTTKKRLFQLMAWVGVALAGGLAYAVFCRVTGMAVPCPFRFVTGLLCPGCGVTRMCLALLRLDFRGAWNANPGLLLLLPLLFVLLGQTAWRYVKTGSGTITRTQSIVVWVMVIYLFLYGVLRNLPF